MNQNFIAFFKEVSESLRFIGMGNKVTTTFS